MRDKIEATVEDFLSACNFAGETKRGLKDTFMAQVDAYAQKEAALVLVEAAAAIHDQHPLVSLRIAAMANKYAEMSRADVKATHAESLARAGDLQREAHGQLRLF